MSSKVTFVSYEEHLEALRLKESLSESRSTKICKFFLAQGFVPASLFGEAVQDITEFEPHARGVLYRDPAIEPKKAFFGLITRNPERVFLGRIWFGRHNEKNVTDNHWVFEAYGLQYVELVKKLIEAIAEEFDVEITIVLVSETAHLEFRDSGDISCC